MYVYQSFSLLSIYVCNAKSVGGRFASKYKIDFLVFTVFHANTVDALLLICYNIISLAGIVRDTR